MKKSKLLILFPIMGLFLSGCTFQEGLQSTKSWINSHIYQPLKSFFGSSSTPSEEGKKDEEKKFMKEINKTIDYIEVEIDKLLENMNYTKMLDINSSIESFRKHGDKLEEKIDRKEDE